MRKKEMVNCDFYKDGREPDTIALTMTDSSFLSVRKASNNQTIGTLFSCPPPATIGEYEVGR
jgi:hypothetical protein